MPTVCPSRTMRARRVSLCPVATFAPSTKKVARTRCSASASSTASVQRPFGPSSKVRATAGTAGEPRTNTSRRRLPSGRRTPGTPQAASATAATVARTLPLDARDPVAVEVDLHRRPAVLPVRPHGRVEGRRPMRRRIAERHQHLVARHADVDDPLVDELPDPIARALRVPGSLALARRLLRGGVVADAHELRVRVFGEEEAVETLIHGEHLVAVLEDEGDRRMTGGLELHALAAHLEDLDPRPERDERALQVVRVAHLGLLVPHVAAEVPRLARHRMRDARTLAGARQRERAERYEGAHLFSHHTSSSACRVRSPTNFWRRDQFSLARRASRGVCAAHGVRLASRACTRPESGPTTRFSSRLPSR